MGEYVDSPLLRERVKRGGVLYCRVDGNFGTYATSSQVRADSASACTCPSELSPCKHVAALRRTFEVNPQSFLDVASVKRRLARLSRAALAAALASVAFEAPAALARAAPALVGDWDPGTPDSEDEGDWE